MIRFSEDATEKDIDNFIASLPETFFTHKDVMRCYSIYQRREFHRNAHALKPTEQRLPETPAQKKRKERKVWNENEVEALKQGVEKHGVKNWTAILKEFPTVFGPNGRTAKDLDKKWQRMAAKGDTKPSENLMKSMAIPPID